MKLFMWGLIALVCVAGVVAEQMNTYIGEPTTITTACIRNSQLRSSATASIIIYDSAGAEIVPQTAMTPSGNGTFSFTYTFTAIGGFNTRETCDFSGILADGSTLITVLKPNFGSMQVVAQGVAQVDINRPVVSEWLILLPNSTNTSTSSITVTGGSCGVQEMNGSQLPIVVTTATTSDRMTASFIAGQLDGFVEGTNYQVLCNITLTDGMYVNGVKNYVYVNSQASFLQYILQLLGLAQNTNNVVNETLSISNQTLQIVSGLNVTSSGATIYEQLPVLKVSEGAGWDGFPLIMSARLSLGSVNVGDSVCTVLVTDQVSGSTVLLQNASFNAVREQYELNWTPNTGGSFASKWSCTGGNISSRILYDSSSVEVQFGAVMQSVS